MKNIKNLILISSILLLLLTIIMGCSTQTEIINNNSIISENVDNLNFRILKSEKTDSEGNITLTNYTYDENNNIIEEKTTYNNNIIHKINYTYNEDNLLIKKEEIYEKNNPTITKYTYDEKNQLIKENWEQKGHGSGYVSYKYNEDGRLIFEEKINDTPMIIDDEYHSREMHYNDKGLIVKIIEVESHGIRMTKIKTYDENDNLLKIDFSTTAGYEFNYEYTYNNNGDVLTEIYSDNEGISSNISYSYDDKNQLIEGKSELYIDYNFFDFMEGDGNKLFSINNKNYEYNEKGLLIKEIYYSKRESFLSLQGEEITKTIIYTYDENKNISKIEYSDTSGLSHTTIKYYEQY